MSVRSQFSQYGNQAVFTFYRKGLEKDDLAVALEPKSLWVTTNKGDGRPEISSTIALPHSVVMGDPEVMISEYRVEVRLTKERPDVTWRDPLVAHDSPAFHGQNKDLTELIAEVEKEHKSSPDDMFKKIYAGANEDTRRAMIKSYQTSGGTVLSTHWDEVKSHDYEQEMKEKCDKGEYRKLV